MEFMVRLQAEPPSDMTTEQLNALYSAERVRGVDLARAGVIKRAWRIPDSGKGLLLMEAEDEEELRRQLATLPLYPYCSVEIGNLTEHPVETILRESGWIPGAQ